MAKPSTRWATSYKHGYNSTYTGNNPRYTFIKPFIGIITQFITSRGPPFTFILKQQKTWLPYDGQTAEKPHESDLVVATRMT